MHVLVLTILILPMFVLAPTLVASPNETLVSHEQVDTSLPAQFVEETLRVAVYAEDNLTLPTYATGGVYTDNYQNVIDLLESAGYAVTALSTQDILDHKLMVADFDAFVLPDQLPRENITNYIMDYWLGGGGILSFESAVGYLFYAGMIDPSYEGDFMLFDINPDGRWAYLPYDGVLTQDRHPVTKSLDADTEYPFTEEAVYLVPLLGERYHELAIWPINPDWSTLFAIENIDVGGKIVQLPGNCSQFESWMEPVVVDAIDWLAPRPKARILYDLTHSPVYGIDTWDVDHVQSPTTQIDMRGFLVNRSYTFDKLHPPENLTSQNLEGYDILVVCDPNINFTAAEVAAVTDWVTAGGSILGIADHTISKNQNMNYLLSNMDIAMNLTHSGTNTLVPSGVHVTHEGTSTMGCLAPGGVSTPDSAFSIWEDTVGGVPVVGGDQHGNGRVILIADGAIMRDVRIGYADNAKALINFANWLSAATAEVLLHVDNNGIPSPWDAPAVDALNDLGIDFYLTFSESYMNRSLHDQQWSLVILDSCWPGIGLYLDEVSSYIDGGGDLIVSWHQVDTFDGDPLFRKIGFDFAGDLPDKVPFYIWDTDHGIFNYPNDYGALNFTSVDDYGDEGDLLTVYANATALGGYTDTNLSGNATTVLGFNEQVIWNSYLIDQLTGDYDESTYSDSFELWQNEIAFLYYDRPTINHPADVTYMETETGNEITWTPAADAGPLEYVFSVNGTPTESGRWDGSAFTFNVDGVNVSITEYELIVYDRLGYSVSDLVILNVTEYVEPPPGPGGIDPTLFIIIGAAVAGVVIILVVVMKRKKK